MPKTPSACLCIVTDARRSAGRCHSLVRVKKTALFDAMCERGLEGIIAKRLRDPYRPATRRWVKTTYRATPRFAEELAGANGRSSSQRGER